MCLAWNTAVRLLLNNGNLVTKYRWQRIISKKMFSNKRSGLSTNINECPLVTRNYISISHKHYILYILMTIVHWIISRKYLDDNWSLFKRKHSCTFCTIVSRVQWFWNVQGLCIPSRIFILLLHLARTIHMHDDVCNYLNIFIIKFDKL